MSQMFRLFFAVSILLGATFMAASDAEARKFRFGGGSKSKSYSSPSSRSSTTVVVVPSYRSGSGTFSRTSNNGVSDSKPVDANGIQLVYDMPNTSDYAYGSGYFDVGFRQMADDAGEYVIYAGPHFMQLKPKLQGQIAERLGFDPVEEHKKIRRERGQQVPEAPAATTKPVALASAAPSKAADAAPTAAVSSGGTGLLPFVIFFVVLGGAGAAFFALQRRGSGSTVEVGRASMEERVNARLQAMRT